MSVIGGGSLHLRGLFSVQVQTERLKGGVGAGVPDAPPDSAVVVVGVVVKVDCR